MDIVDGLSDSLPLMNDESPAAVAVMQSERAGEHIDRIWKRMGVPGKDAMWRDGHLQGGELRLSGGVVGVRFAIPGLRGLQQDFALGSLDVRSPALREDGG